MVAATPGGRSWITGEGASLAGARTKEHSQEDLRASLPPATHADQCSPLAIHSLSQYTDLPLIVRETRAGYPWGVSAFAGVCAILFRPVYDLRLSWGIVSQNEVRG